MYTCQYCGKKFNKQRMEEHIRGCPITFDKDRQCSVCLNAIEVDIPDIGKREICLQRKFIFASLDIGESSVKNPDGHIPIYINDQKIMLANRYKQLNCRKFKYDQNRIL